MDEKINQEGLPAHVAIIMDGNGRWAAKQKLPRTQGHWEGLKRVEEIINTANVMGIKVLTLFTFSTENWSRPENEVSVLMKMITDILVKKINVLKDGNIQFHLMGRLQGIPKVVLTTIQGVEKETESNTGMILNMAFNYGSRQEIVDAVQAIAADVVHHKISLDQIDEAMVSRALYTRNLPDPDLLIRTSGEKRISNFLLWQLSYAEFYFTDKLWPEFTSQEFHRAILDYQKRERRYGAVNV
jgi:undecaprenyl diphosphate synthase